MDTYERGYTLASGTILLSITVKVTFTFDGERRAFQTPCIPWEAHEGFGRVTSFGLGIVRGYGLMYLTTPQTYQLVGGLNWGFDISIGTFVGGWVLSDGPPRRIH
jgi:hypothetical protein